MMNREIFHVVVKGKEVYYRDRKWNKSIRCIPQDKGFISKIKMSRNIYPHFLIDLFNLTKKEQKQYDKAETEEDLAEILKVDCFKIGAKLIDGNA